LLKELTQRDFSTLDLLVIYIDGMRIGDYHVITAVGVDVEGRKHVLGLREGATENAELVKWLVEELVQRGVKPSRRRLFGVHFTSLRSAERIQILHDRISCRPEKLLSRLVASAFGKF
jgi:hypothetical protein